MSGKNHLYAKSGGMYSPQTFLKDMDLLCKYQRYTSATEGHAAVEGNAARGRLGRSTTNEKYLFRYYYLFQIIKMPVFLEVRKVPFNEEQLKEICVSPVDEFGVRHVNLLYNKDVGICFCLLDGPDIDAIGMDKE